MKKFSKLIICAFMFICGLFIASCGANGNSAGRLILSKSQVVIYIGETEDNTEVVNVRLVDVDVNALSLLYDNTNIQITPSAKLTDGSFDLYISPKTELAVDEVRVTVRAGANTEATFSVIVVVPVTQITAPEGLYIPFNGEATRYNITDRLTFTPSGANGAGVDYSILNADDFVGSVSLQNGELLIANTFDYFDQNIVIRAQATSGSGAGSVFTDFNVKVVPNARLVANGIDMAVNYNGNYGANIKEDGYYLQIENGTLETFEVEVTIPNSLGIEVDVDTAKNEQENIMYYLNYTKAVVEKDANSMVYLFTFESSNLKPTQSAGMLYFKFFYTLYKNNSILTADFVKCVNSENSFVVRDALPINIVVPIESINIITETAKLADESYLIYENYGSVYGSEFTFVTVPASASDKRFKISNITNVDVYVLNGANSYVKLFAEDIFYAGDLIYICASANRSGSTPKLTIESLAAFSVEPVTLYFTISSGASQFGFVEDFEAGTYVQDKKVAVGLNDDEDAETSVLLYAPGALIEDLSFEEDETIRVVPFALANYFNVLLKPGQIGVRKYSFKTLNGFEASLSVETIRKLTDVRVNVNGNAEGAFGVGRVEYDLNSSLTEISVKYGYAIPLKYLYADGVNIASINYSFVDAIYGDDEYTSAYNTLYKNFAVDDFQSSAFKSISSVVNAQDLKEANIITTNRVGKTYVKIDVIGYDVDERGKVSEAAPITLYLLIEVYRPLKDIDSTDKLVELRAQNQLVEADLGYATTTISLNGITDGGRVATYNRVYIDNGFLETTEEDGVVTTYITYEFNDLIHFKAVLNIETNELVVTIISVPDNFDYENDILRLVLFAVDFDDIVSQTDSFSLSAYINDDSVKTYDIFIKVNKTKAIEDVEVTSLKLESEDEISKTYEEIYIDVSTLSVTSTNIYNIFTNVYPVDAFNKNLIYSFEADTGYTSSLVDISGNDGRVYIPGTIGGKGKIIIVPEYTDSSVSVKKVIIPIVIADGNSFDTAFRISNLLQVGNLTKHYKIVGSETLVLNTTLFKGEVFNGGLYGKVNEDDMASTIYLNGCSLFDSLGSYAVVKDLVVYGTSNNQGMIANLNRGEITNIEITSFISNGYYIPSLVCYEGLNNVGGVVGTNYGTITNASFLGSIATRNENSIGGICGQNEGTLADCKIIVARFMDSLESADRTIVVVDEDTIINIVNGIIFIDNTAPSREFTEDGVSQVISYADEGNQLSGNVYVKTDTGHMHSIGDESTKYGIVYYYMAKDSTYQSKLKTYNTIMAEDLVSTNLGGAIKLSAIDGHGMNSNVATIVGNTIQINGVGEFDLVVYSAYDYTQSVTLHMLSVYYIEEIVFKEGVEKLISGSTIKILADGKAVISSLPSVKIDGIELKQNDFSISFYMFDSLSDLQNWQNVIDATRYVTGSNFGNHTINAIWNRDELTKYLTAQILGDFHEAFNELINSNYLKDYYVELSLRRGTTNISVSASEGSIEPKDTFIFTASITTDMDTDYIDSTLIRIENETGYDVTSAFNIYVGAKILTEIENVYSFEVVVELKNEYKHSLNYVDRQYTIIVRAANTNDGVTTIYGAKDQVKLTVLPQSISSIHASMYERVSGYSVGGNDYSVVSWTNPTSVIKPTGRALLVVDLFPNYATFDYIDVVATSNTLAQLAYRIQKKNNDVYSFDNNARYQILPDVNGIRINNNFSGNDELIQNVGSYYLIVFPTNTLNQDAIITITISAYYNGEKLDKETSFVLYVKTPEKPEISIDGQTYIYAHVGETLSATANISNEQSISKVYVTDANDNILDYINVQYEEIGSTNAGYKQYRLTFIVPSTSNSRFTLNQNTIPLRLYVESERVERGEQIKAVSAPISIYVTEFSVEENSILIKDVNENKLEVNSIKPKLLELYTNFSYENYEEALEAVDEFNNNYYYKNSYFSGSQEKIIFELGNNNGSVAYNLISYLYYVNGNQVYSIGRVVDGINGKEFIAVEDPQYNQIISFSVIDEKLYVMGGDRVGQVPMLLRLFRTMPDGTQFVYEYNFTITNSLYTTEDMPIEIVDADAFTTMNDSEVANDYILSSNIYLYDYEAIPNTSKIKSLDGNNYTINIVSFKEPTTTSATFALFNTISPGTTIKNVTINYYYLNEIVLGEDITRADFAGVAINNSGVIYNTEVMTFASAERKPTFTTYGLKLTAMNTSATINMAGFVITNNGSITNSRVGGDSKLVTSFNYKNSTGENAVKPKLNSSVANAYMFTLRAGGTLSGFVINNTGVISSSFVKNVNIINTYNRNQTMVTSGFVNTNDGTIAMSYVEGVKDDTQVQSMAGGIEGTGILTGFVYTNTRTITDSYSNIMIKTSSGQVGRLGAGFVYNNTATGEILRSYSFSSIAENNSSQLNFVGVTDLMEYNNKGLIKSCYYFTTDATELSTVEPVYNTDIQSVKNVGTKINFYGYSFGDSAKGLEGTWRITTTGPKLISTDNITHSVRYKADNNGNVSKTSSLDYVFVYDENYDYGTTNNPIIIRNAQEFNDVFGGTSTETAGNVENGYAFGSYRLINNINLKELIINEQDVVASDYKYTLKSTDITLTGKYKYLSNRPGALDGNGLTINYLAISNPNKTSAQNYGMFKSIENGASIKNLNVGLDAGGVNADHTVNVGTIAGTMTDSVLVNVKVFAMNGAGKTEVVGTNIVGGVVGRVAGNCYVAGITVENVSVTATYNQSESFEVRTEYTGSQRPLTNNTPNMEGTGLDTLSLSGGAFGVLDIYTLSELLTQRVIANTDLREANVQNIATSGSGEISAMTVGGVAGYIGKFVVAKDLSYTISRGAKLTAYNCFAGGIAGYSNGYLYQIKAQHETIWQENIELNIQNYYKTDENYDRGELHLFDADENIGYRPNTIGGLVGVMNRGLISIGYSKLNVTNNNAKFAGGIIGMINPAINSGNADDIYQIQISEVYATGDVYAGGTESYTGGVIGYNRFTGLDLNKVAALNVWSKETISHVKVNNIYRIAQIAVNNAPNGDENMALSNISSLNNGVGDAENKPSVIFADGTTAIIPAVVRNNSMQNGQNLGLDDLTTIPSYYNYSGLSADGGALVDTAFKQTGWYGTSNWLRKNGKLYPEIRYIESVSVYIISTVEDFELIRRYGGNPDAQFIIVNSINNCNRIKISYPVLRGSLVGLNEEITLTGLSVPLIKTLNGAQVYNIKFDKCSAPIANESINNTFIHDLLFTNCNFTSVSNNPDGTYDKAGVVFKADNTIFQTIEFQNCQIITDNNVRNAGFVFASSYGSSEIIVRGLIIGSDSFIGSKASTKTRDANFVSSKANIGFVFGATQNPTTLINANVYGAINARISNSTSGQETANIGVIGGFANSDNFEITNMTITGSKISVIGYGEGTNQLLNIGGMIGYAKAVNVIYDSILEASTGCDITVAGEYFTANVGGIIGRAGEGGITYTSEINVKFGYKSKYNYNNITVDSPIIQNSTLMVGGLCGSTETLLNSGNNLNYLGDILINQTSSNVQSYVYAGGIVGKLSGGTLTKVTFGGVIAPLGNEQNKATNYVGGIVGGIDTQETTIDNSYSFGDIMSNQNESYFNGNTSYFGGIVGQAKAKVNFEKIVSLTTLYSLHNNSHVYDAITTLNNAECLGGVVDTYYASNLTLCVSDIVAAKNKTYTQIMDATTGIISSDARGLFDEGSKVNPFIYTSETNTQVQDEDNYGYTVRISNNVQTITSKSNLRRVYFNLKSIKASDLFLNQIELENVGMFADGASITTTLTPFERINNTSFVAGIKSRIYSDEYDVSLNNVKTKAGFVNHNNGVVYTCGAEETYVDYESLNSDNLDLVTTHFYGQIRTKAQYVAGFIFINTGYVFGSYSNMYIYSAYSGTGESVVAGFIYSNAGVVEYSYASGYAQFENNRNNSLDLFIYHNNEEAKSLNCYTIFANNVNNSDKGVTTTINSPGCIYEMDASEAIAVRKTEDSSEIVHSSIIYGQSLGDYLTSDEDYNYNYPTLSKGAFAEIPYTKRLTNVSMTEKIVIDSGEQITSKYYFVNELGTAGGYKQINNLTALTKVSANSNYVLIRGLNFGYLSEVTRDANGVLNITTSNLLNENDKTNSGVYKLLNSTSNFISSSDGALVGMNFNGNGNALHNITLNNDSHLIEYLPNGSTIENLTFNNIYLKNSSGIILNNQGIIKDIEIEGDIKYTASSNVVGALIANNDTTGKISNTTLRVGRLTGANASVNYAFGTLVGKNMGEIENITATIGRATIIENLDYGQVIFGSIVGTNAGGAISKCGLFEGSNIYVVCKGTVRAGGILGSGDEGIVKTCYTEQGAFIKGGAEDTGDTMVIDNAEISVPATNVSYIGGIIGSGSYLLSIQDCYNGADVTASALWEYEEANGVRKNRYKYSEQLKSIYVLELGTSRAYAGGIIANYLSAEDIEPLNNDGTSYKAARLSNSGNIAGGFKAWKPVMVLTTRNGESFKAAMWAIGGGIVGIASVGGGVAVVVSGMLLAVGKAGMILSWNPVGWFLLGIAAVGAVGATVVTINSANEAMTAHLNYVPVAGNSNNYYNLAGNPQQTFVATDSNAKYLYGENGCMTTESQMHDFMDNFFVGNIKYLQFESVITDEDTKYEKDCWNGLYFGDATNGAGVSEGQDTLQELMYDAIAPTITKPTNSRTVTGLLLDSDVANYVAVEGGHFITNSVNVDSTINNVSGIRLKTSNVANARLIYWSGNFQSGKNSDIKIDDDHIYKSDYDTKANSPKLRCEKYSGNVGTNWSSEWNNDGSLVASVPELLVPIKGKGTMASPYRFVITKASKWKQLVYTINNTKYTSGDYENFTAKECTRAEFETELVGTYKYNGSGNYNNSLIIINVGVESKIVVSNNVFNTFGGTINIVNGSTFTDMKLIMSDETSYGLIKKVNGTLNISGFNYSGDVSVVVDSKETGITTNANKYNSTFGLLVGTVQDYSKVYVNYNISATCNIDINNLLIPDSVADRFNSISAFVGTMNNGEVGINNSNITLNTFNLIGKAFGESTQTKHAFGGFVAKINNASSVVTMDNSSFTCEKIILQSGINNVGGLVGYNNGSVNTSNITLKIGELKAVSYGNVSVGGAFGFNDGAINMSNTIMSNYGERLVISADVINGLNSAYAGGIVGATSNNNIGIYNNIAIMGASGTNNNVGYIFAGYNKVSDSNIYSVPSKAYSGKIVGYGNIDLSGSNKNISLLVCRSVAINNTSTKVTMANEIINGDNTYTLKYITIKDINGSGDADDTYDYDLPNALKDGINSGYVVDQITSYNFTMSNSNYIYSGDKNLNFNLADHGYSVDGNKIYHNKEESYDGKTYKINNYNTYEITNSQSYYSYDENSNDVVLVYEANIKFTSYYDNKTFNTNTEQYDEFCGKYEAEYKLTITKTYPELNSPGEVIVRILYLSSNGTGVFSDIDVNFEQNEILCAKKLAGDSNDEFIDLNIGLNAGLAGYAGPTKVGTHSNGTDIYVTQCSTLLPLSMSINYNSASGKLSLIENLRLKEETFGMWTQLLTWEEVDNIKILDLDAKLQRTIATVNLNKEEIFNFDNLSITLPSAGNKILCVKDSTNGTEVVKDNINITTGGLMYKGYLISDSLYDPQMYYNGNKLTSSGIKLYSGAISGKSYIIISLYEKDENVSSMSSRNYYNYTEHVYEISNSKFALKATLTYRMETSNYASNLLLTSRYNGFMPVTTETISNVNVEYSDNNLTFNSTQIQVDGLQIVVPNKLKFVFGNSTYLECTSKKVYSVVLKNASGVTLDYIEDSNPTVNVTYSAIGFSGVTREAVADTKIVINLDQEHGTFTTEEVEDYGEGAVMAVTVKYLYNDVVVGYVVEQVIDGASTNIKEFYYIYGNEYIDTNSSVITFRTFK